MRVLMVAQDFPPATGGIQTYAAELAERLSTRVSALEVVCPAADGGPALDRQRPYLVHRVRGGTELFPGGAALRIAELMRARRFDVAFHTQWQSLPSSAALRRTGILARLAVAVHGKELLLRPLARLPRAQRAYDRVRAYLLRSADVVLPVSQFSAQLLAREVGAARCVQVVPNGVSAERFARADAAQLRARLGLKRAPLLLSVARLVPRKGVDQVLRVLPNLIARLPDLHYLVAGEGPDAARLRNLARAYGVAERVHFLGRVEDAALGSCYAACDLFVLPTRDEPDSVEGFGLALLEASACGRPTLTSDAGGTREAVLDGVTGRVVRAGDDAALTEAALQILQDRGLAERMGEAGRRYAQGEGSWERAAERIHEALRWPPSG